MEEPPFLPEAPPETAEPPPPRMSLGARLLNVFAIPGDVFSEVKASPPSPSNWLVPACLLIVVGWVGVWLVFSQPTIQHQVLDAFERSIDKSMAQQHVPKEQAETVRQSLEKYGVTGAKMAFGGGITLVAIASPLLWGLALWLIGVKIFKRQFSYGKAVEIVGLANAIAVLEAVVRVLLILGLDKSSASASAALFVKDFDPQKPSHAMLAAVNIMTFWLLMVRAVGFSRLASLPLSRAALWIFGIWAALTFVGLSFAAAGQAFGH